MSMRNPIQKQAGAAQAPVAAIAVNSSRNLSNADAGKVLTVKSANVVLTVVSGLNLVPGVIIQKHTSGTSIAFTGTTGNGAATTLPITGQMSAIVPENVSDAYRISGV
jgi:hypothetical protein